MMLVVRDDEGTGADADLSRAELHVTLRPMGRVRLRFSRR